MVKTIIAALLILLLGSCSRDFYVKKYCPVVSTKDSIRVDSVDRFVVRDSLIPIPGEKIFIHDSLPCPDFKAEVHGKKGNARVEIKDSIITVECEIDSQQVAISWVEHHTDKITQSFHSEVRQVTGKPNRTFWSWLGYWESWACMGTIMLIIFLWQRKRIIPLIRKMLTGL